MEWNKIPTKAGKLKISKLIKLNHKLLNNSQKKKLQNLENNKNKNEHENKHSETYRLQLSSTQNNIYTCECLHYNKRKISNY